MTQANGKTQADQKSAVGPGTPTLEVKGGKVVIPRGITPVGLIELAAILQVSRDTVDKWRTRDLLPAPEWTVGGRPAWNLATIAKWIRDTDRTWLLTEPVS